MERFVFGADLGGTTVKLGLCREDGTLLEKREIPTRTEHAGEGILPDIAAQVAALCRDCLGDGRELAGIGLGVPGVVMADGFVQPCVNLGGWGGFDAAGELARMCSVPARALNDANAATLGELWLGGGAGAQNMVFVTLGTGVGGGVVVERRLLAGAHGSGGEIGHIKLYGGEGRLCGCGSHGCLERYASATAIAEMASQRLRQDGAPSALRGVEPVTAKDVMDCAKAGDALALDVVESFADDLGRGLAAIACVCDPEVFVLGGGVSKAGEFLLDQVRRAYLRYAFSTTRQARFGLAKLGNDAGILGCAYYALTHLPAGDRF